MNTFLYRDRRRERVAAVLAVLNEQVRALLDEITAMEADPAADPAALAAARARLDDMDQKWNALIKEQPPLAREDWLVSDLTYRLAGGDWLWAAAAAEIEAGTQADPVLQALGEVPLTTPELAQGLALLPRGGREAPGDWLDQVQVAVGGDEAVLAELLYTGHRLRLLGDNPIYPYDDVGVLLPLRLETLFDPPPEGRTQWQILLRVMPDEASIRRDNPKVGDGERAALLAFWNAVKQPGEELHSWLEGDTGKAEWNTLCSRVGAARAAWLAAAFVPRLEGDAVALDIVEQARDLPNRVGGLPPVLDVWVMADDTPVGPQQVLVGQLKIAEDALRDQALELPLPDSIDSVKQSWWASWEKAQASGLGGIWDLPEGISPENISALYVVGIGEEDPHAQFRAQADAGELGLLRLGAPTNTVAGEPPADLAKDNETWRVVAVNRILEGSEPHATKQGTAARNIALQLLGDADGLPFFPGADAPDDTELSQAMAQALWPALWGHWLHDVWPGGEEAHRTGLWAMRYLLPEGPLAPLRISAQPYGLLPTTALTQWAAGPHDDPAQRDLEQRMAGQVADLRSILARKARDKRRAAANDTRDLVERLSRDGTSRTFLWRQFLPVNIAAFLHAPNGALTAQLTDATKQFYQAMEERVGQPPTDYYAALGYPVLSRLPLVKPGRMIYLAKPDREGPQRVPLLELLQALMRDWALETFYEVLDGQDRRHFVLPDSLYVRLLVNAVQVGMQWFNSDQAPLTRELIDIHQKAAQRLAEELDREEWSVEDRDPFTGEPVWRLDKMPDEFRLAAERALGSTLDTAAHRIDPWVTGFAWQRLREIGSGPRRQQRLGVYGWLDGPFVGRPGPTDAGRLHAPSHAQALAGLILRDQYLSTQRRLAGPAGRNRWHMDIDSRKVRVAQEIADEVRLGFNIHEIAGRHVESILRAHQTVKEVRTSEKYAMHPDRRDPHEVCDGIRALKGLLKGGDAEAVLSVEELRLDQPGQPPGDPDFPLADEQRFELKLLHLALDTYADLLMTDGVLQVVNRQIERAAESMDAAAGFARPPTFEFIRTPPSGYQLETRVLTVLPFIDGEGIADDDAPCRIAEPAVVAYVEQQLGSAWQWVIVDADQPDTVLAAVVLGQLGLTAADALVLSAEFLSEAARLRAGYPLLYIGEGHNRRWEAVDGGDQVIAAVSLVELGLTPSALALLSDEELDQQVRAALGAAEGVSVREAMLEDPRLWSAQDEYGVLLGIVTAADLALAPGEVPPGGSDALQAMVRTRLGLVRVQVNSPREHRLAREIAAGFGGRPAAGRDLASDAAVQRATDDNVRVDLLARYQALYTAGGVCVNESGGCGRRRNGRRGTSDGAAACDSLGNCTACRPPRPWSAVRSSARHKCAARGFLAARAGGPRSGRVGSTPEAGAGTRSRAHGNRRPGQRAGSAGHARW